MFEIQVIGTPAAGNPITPLSYQLHSLSAAQSNAAQVGSMTPPVGALNVPVDSTIQLLFTHAMDPTSVNMGLHVTADGILVAGSTTVSSDGTTFTFHPSAPFNKGASVSVVVGAPAEDMATQEVTPFSASFTVIKDSTMPAVVALSSSATAVDVRFDAPLDHHRPDPYLRSGFERIASHWELRGSDWLRIVPDTPLQTGHDYRLVLDPHTEFPLRLLDDSQPLQVDKVVYDGRTLRLRFNRELGFPSIELTAPDGSTVAYDPDRTIDDRELRLRLRTEQLGLVVHAFGLAPLTVTLHP
jgi:Bacterial Ig-like domain